MWVSPFPFERELRGTSLEGVKNKMKGSIKQIMVIELTDLENGVYMLNGWSIWLISKGLFEDLVV